MGRAIIMMDIINWNLGFYLTIGIPHKPRKRASLDYIYAEVSHESNEYSRSQLEILHYLKRDIHLPLINA